MASLLRLATAGSVDDGKSTLIGRLLYDSKSLMADQVADAEVDLARLTDGLRAEREQGITIDVAYRFFATPERSFIIADTPGHVRYTRNMVTGASTADLAMILIDARNGVVEQSRRHAFISSLLDHLEHVHIASDRNLIDGRFPVQYVIRPMSDEHHDYRGYAGQVAGGILRPGDEVVVLPAGLKSRVKSLD